MFYFIKELDFYKGKSDCKAIVIGVWSLRQGSGGYLGYKAPKIFGLLTSFWKLNVLQRH